MTGQTEDSASARLYELARLAQSQRGISLGEILCALGRTSMGFTVLVLALPPMIPVPGPFGVVFGTALAIVAVQIAIGRQSIWLPSFLSRRRLSPAVVEIMVRYSAPILARIEAMVRPGRLAIFTGGTMQWLLTFPIFVLAVTIALPIPLGNFLPVLALIVISVALMAKDGLITLAGLVLCVLAVAATAWLLQIIIPNLSGASS